MKQGSGNGAKLRLVRDEKFHRRTVLGGIAALLLLSTSPVLAHHLARSAQGLVGNADHLGALCMAALLMLLEPVHYAFHLLLAGGLIYAAWDRVRAARSLTRALAPLDARMLVAGEPFWQAARATGIDPARVRVVASLPTAALTAGIIRPLIYVSRELLDVLSQEELIAVLAHEGAHLTRRDPLRLSLFRFLACTLFWLPALRQLADDMADEAEVLADDKAREGGSLALATAILALAARVPDRALAAAVGFAQPSLLERRVRRLTGERVPARTHLTRNSLVGAFAALLLVWTSGIAAAAPRQRMAPHQSYCATHEHRALRHLFCRGARSAYICPHPGGSPSSLAVASDPLTA